MNDSRLTVCIFSITPSLLTLLKQQLQQGSFLLNDFSDREAFIAHILHEEQTIDCLIFEDGAAAHQMFAELQHRNLLLPCLLITDGSHNAEPNEDNLDADEVRAQATSHSNASDPTRKEDSPKIGKYHRAMQQVSRLRIEETQGLSTAVEKAINIFLQLPSESPLLAEDRVLSDPALSQDIFTSLSNKQRRLSAKLQERLGYMGVYYKRNPDSFLKRMSLEEKQAFLDTLRKGYRDIILNYFSEATDLNERIDQYVTTAFFADVPTAQMVQIHMELMDEFSQQLKLEGRNEEILLDYRLTLIDVMANLCELYRRSIPRL